MLDYILFKVLSYVEVTKKTARDVLDSAAQARDPLFNRVQR
jgi:hypothetical protein